MGRRFRFIVVASVVWAASHAAFVVAAMTPAPPAQAPSPSPTEGFHGAVCGDGILQLTEQCDDGNPFSGDGCSFPNCSPETMSTEAFVAFEQIVARDFVETRWLSGQVTFAQPRGSLLVSTRAFETTPIGLAQQGTLCIRAVVPPDQAFGPGNVGFGGLSSGGGPFTILTATLHLQQWLNPFPGVDSGPDGVPCTEDDPGFRYTSMQQRQVRLYLRLRPVCNGDGNGDGQVTIDEILDAVNSALTGCPGPVP